MRLSSVSLPVVLLFAAYSIFGQHSSGGGSSSGSSSGGGSHSSSSGGSSSSGSSHGPGGGSSYSGGSHSSGDSHPSASRHSASGGEHSSPGGHTSGSTSIYRGSGSHGKDDRGSNLTTTARNGSGKSEIARPIHEPRVINPERTVQPERRGFFSRLFHPARKPQPKPEPKPALYLPRPICPHGRCTPACPVGQVRNGGACTTPVIHACVSGQQWNSNICGYNRHYNCPIGQNWNGITCTRVTSFLDSCYNERARLQRQIQRVQVAESTRQSACANGMTQECSQATGTLQNEERLRQSLLARYQQCQAQSASSRHGGYYPPAYDSIGWFDSLRFDANF